MKQRIDVGCPHVSMQWYTNLLSPHSTLYNRTSGKANHGTSPGLRPYLTKEDQLYIIVTKHTALEQWVWPVYELQISTDHLMPTRSTLIIDAVSASKNIMQQFKLGASFEWVEFAL